MAYGHAQAPVDGPVDGPAITAETDGQSSKQAHRSPCKFLDEFCLHPESNRVSGFPQSHLTQAE